jgi:transcriptional regulator with XRE-family HTH domain
MIHDRIKQRMVALNLKAINLTTATGATKATVSYWLKGSNDPSAKYMKKLADALGCQVDWLVFGYEPGDRKSSCADICADKYTRLTDAQQSKIAQVVDEMTEENIKTLGELRRMAEKP